MRQRRFVIGDIHGRHEALVEVLEKSKFDYNDDLLIVLGDIVDGGVRTYEVVEELLKIKHLVYVIGNHDEWFMNHISSGWAEDIWLSQGGRHTIASYGGIVVDEPTMQGHVPIVTKNINIPVTHQDFFNCGVYYYTVDRMVFVHGGFIPGVPLHEQRKFDLLWDRELIKEAQDHVIPPWDKVFVGHTTTQTYDEEKPIRFHNLYMVDCGAGWNGRLAMMDIDTDEFWLSKRQEPMRDKVLTDASYKKLLKALR